MKRRFGFAACAISRSGRNSAIADAAEDAMRNCRRLSDIAPTHTPFLARPQASLAWSGPWSGCPARIYTETKTKLLRIGLKMKMAARHILALVLLASNAATAQ